MFKRPPDRIIGDNYLHRWHVIPRNPFFNIYLHKFLGSDDDRALHDHPWWSVSVLLAGGLREFHTIIGPGWTMWQDISRFVPVFRRPTSAHRLELIKGPAWTLFITGPVVRPWGFWCGDRWVHHKDFTDETGNNIGRGCE